jgi:MFS transporter, MCT family, aspergillic acid transporter
MGIVLLGASAGSIITPILLQHIIVLHGFPWAVRITAFIYLFFAVIGILTVKSRFPPNPQHVPLDVVKATLSDRTYIYIVIPSVFAWLTLFIPYNFIVVQARTQVGMSARLANYLLPICNAWTIPGIIIPSMLADRYDRWLVTSLLCLLSGIVVLACWIPANSNAVVIVFASLYGFCVGGYPPVVSTKPLSLYFFNLT